MPARTRSRSSGGGATAVVSASIAAVSRRPATSTRQSRAGPQVRLEARALEVVQGVDGVRAGEQVEVVGVVGDVVVHCATPSVSRIRISPSRIRVLAVPIGRSSIVATSVCV